MGHRTQPSREHCSTPLTSLPVGTASRCRRNHSSAGVNVKFKLLFFAGEQPRHGQFCRTPRHGQNGSSPVSLVGPCITGATSPLLTVELETTTTQTPRLTQPHQMMTMTSPPSPVNRQHLCSHQASSCPRLPSQGSRLLLFRFFGVTYSLNISSKITGCPG